MPQCQANEVRGMKVLGFKAYVVRYPEPKTLIPT